MNFGQLLDQSACQVSSSGLFVSCLHMIVCYLSIYQKRTLVYSTLIFRNIMAANNTVKNPFKANLLICLIAYLSTKWGFTHEGDPIWNSTFQFSTGFM